MKTIKKITPKNMEALALKLIDYFNSKDCWEEMGIYVNNKRLASDNIRNKCEKMTTSKGTKYYVEKDINVKEYIEYSNPETLTIYFEGPLYNIINYDDYDYLNKLNEKFLKPYGLYFEQGHTWNMSAYS